MEQRVISYVVSAKDGSDITHKLSGMLEKGWLVKQIATCSFPVAGEPDKLSVTVLFEKA